MTSHDFSQWFPKWLPSSPSPSLLMRQLTVRELGDVLTYPSPNPILLPSTMPFFWGQLESPVGTHGTRGSREHLVSKELHLLLPAYGFSKELTQDSAFVSSNLESSQGGGCSSKILTAKWASFCPGTKINSWSKQETGPKPGRKGRGVRRLGVQGFEKLLSVLGNLECHLLVFNLESILCDQQKGGEKTESFHFWLIFKLHISRMWRLNLLPLFSAFPVNW